MYNILLVSTGIFHPPWLGRVQLWRVLRATPHVHLRHARSIEALTRADLAALDAVVLYYHRQTISLAALEALDRFAHAGGGILAVHAATASFKQTPRYTEILGGRFIGHPPVGPLEVWPVGEDDEILGPIPPFTVTDEAYRHELRGDIRVHFVARPHPRPPSPGRRGGVGGEVVPFVWTRRHGAGRVCYVTAGHRAASLRHPCVVHILRAGLTWVCRGREEAAA
jgi:hypothetical protein